MNAIINIPGSKSIAARALICRLLSGHDTVLTNLPDCGDTRGMLRLTEAVRRGMQSGNPVTVDIGEGGTTLRFGMAACASVPGLDITLTGSPRLMERPHTLLIDALCAMGADLHPVPEKNAIHIRGRELKGGIIELDGSVSSQYLSALMLAAPTWRHDTVFRLKAPVVSTPYIAMTAGVIRAFGADVSLPSDSQSKNNSQFSILNSQLRNNSQFSIPTSQLRNNSQFSIPNSQLKISVPAKGYAQCARYDVEGDWSGASYFFETRLIAESLGMNMPELSMPTLKSPAESLQGDSRVAAIFADAARRMREHDATPMTLNLNDAPDLTPAVAVGLAIAGIPFRIEGIAHLRHKESDRMAAISSELRKLGYVIATGDDTMEWNGERCGAEEKPMIKTYLDHRMAMAFAPARLAFPHLTIEDPGVVDKSFPEFWMEFNKISRL